MRTQSNVFNSTPKILKYLIADRIREAIEVS